MRFACLLLVVVACLVASCEVPPEYLSATAINATVQAAVATAQAAMRTPSLTGTVTFGASPSTTATRTLTPTPTSTSTRTLTPTPTPTFTLVPPKLNTAILGCDTGFDITHGMGEVTNAYVRVRNLGGTELTNVCLTLNANDEGRTHPDKTRCLPSLRPNYEVTTILTVDTEYRKLTSTEVAVTTNQGVADRVSGSGCRALDNSELNQIKPLLNVPRPIPGP